MEIFIKIYSKILTKYLTSDNILLSFSYMSEKEYKQTAFRLSTKSLKILDKLKETEDLNTRTMALEFFLREMARIKNLKIDED